jgi:hypothetical protein
MKPTFLWKNFKLCEELSVSGAFVDNGLPDEVFEVFYYL